MKGSPFVRYAAALIGGILFYVWQPQLGWWVAGLGIGGAILFGWGVFRNARQDRKPLSPGAGIGSTLLLFSLGWVITYVHTPATRSDNILHLSLPLEAYEAVIANQPEERAKTYRVELALRRGRVGGTYQPVSGRVIVYLDKSGIPLPQYGERWLVEGTPRLIDPPLNPGEFNYQRFLSYKGIYHQQYLRQPQRQVLGVAPPNRLVGLANAVNLFADSLFTRQVGSRSEYGIINAMILGVRDDVDPEQYRAYAASGAVHILSVSGLHVAILFGVLTVLLGFLEKRRGGKYLLGSIQLLILWFYALMTGFSPPVLRSAGMLTLLIIARMMGRTHSMPNTLAASAFFILSADPYALFSAGFQLSYLAVAGIGAWQSGLYQSLSCRYVWLDKLWAVTALALVAQLATFPLAVFYFHQFPTYFLLANPVVMVLSQVLLPVAMGTLAVCWIPGLNEWAGWVLQKTAWLLNQAVSMTGQLPGAIWDGLWLSPVQLLLIYLIILSGVALLVTRQKTYLWLTCFLGLSLTALLLTDQYLQKHQRRLAVHFLPHKTAVSLTEGAKATLFTDLDLRKDPRSFDFYLKNTFGQWGVTDLSVSALTDTGEAAGNSLQASDYRLMVWQGKRIMLVNRLNGSERWQLPAVVDYLIIRRNALRSWEELNGRVVARHILFDDSNKTALTDQLLAEAATRNIQCFSVRQQGAFVADL
ncbi:ComEC/Rec2 family competence protein [Nibrella saemangeumensis]|uniref:ComEC/Rec2 family competence protein n=1 Tax=Nibrella saemangeumensis TaxID=1084526 RepID=A0ABP8MJP8_9BACT